MGGLRGGGSRGVVRGGGGPGDGWIGMVGVQGRVSRGWWESRGW